MRKISIKINIKTTLLTILDNLIFISTFNSNTLLNETCLHSNFTNALRFIVLRTSQNLFRNVA